MTRGFRFGVNMFSVSTRREVTEKARRAEALGYDVFSVPDHLGMPAPFPTLMLAAEVTERIRLGTCVLNTPFYNPALLARDVAALDQFSGGRVELGLGAGYVREEFDAIGMAMPGPGARVDYIEQTVLTMRKLHSDPAYQPAPARPGGPPVLIAGSGNRLLRIAAQHADVVGLPGAVMPKDAPPNVAGPEQVAERAAYVRDLLGDRRDRVELNLLVWGVGAPADRDGVGARVRAAVPGFTDDRIDEVPAVMVGTPQQIADGVRECRDRYGITYFTVLEADMEAFAPAIELLK
ncbi:TIGR03621 family F420-dependent LLM class oxidoreductase [Nocardia pseudobrasiliensis]|uniref:Putative F420-dependent oxidoreductase n=1 Tax=Nocardia pseudobrasiliensis TaxID=45979 RepID=A0A370IBV7_9NOCA|nr:TIGR03621 family F420-dependent LLM class oxidoreductase [Nocardia pseudobrasiliensis]RDI68187.1 putative F420-dependent oxidoreductase [Nocardia pseudobrasiliensis]